MQKKSYLLTITPPQHIADRVDSYRKQYAHYTSYSIVPHITIYPPFYTKNLEIDSFIRLLEKTFSYINPTKITLDSIGYFEGKNNVAFFVPDEASRKWIKSLFSAASKSIRGEIADRYKDYSSEDSYMPHMTIAEKLPDNKLGNIKDKLDQVDEKLSFEVHAIYLYEKEEDSPEWVEIGKIALG